MANPVHVAKLKEGVSNWNQWRKQNPDEVPDLSGADFDNADLFEGDLEGVIFPVPGSLYGRPVGIQIERLDLSRANLSGASFKGACLVLSIFKDANCHKANFSGSELMAANFSDADLLETDFSQAKLQGACFRSAHLTETIFRFCDLSYASFENAKCYKSDIRHAVLIETNFEKTKITSLKYNRKAIYRGIRVDNCYGNARFKRFAQDEGFVGEIKSSGKTGWILWLLWRGLADCGRTPWLWMFWMLFIIAGFGSIYAGYNIPEWLCWFPDWLKNLLFEIRPEFANVNKSLFTPYFYSLACFTTLGFGDIETTNLCGEVFVCIEVMLGYVMLGGLISIFVSKLARRS
jgi:uncharacterized protein YjbI with pentapeptide repeats